LAGGWSSRIGQDKCQLKIGNRTILKIIIGKLSSFCDEIILVTNDPEAHEKVLRFSCGAKIKAVRDRIPYQGPLEGILAGLSEASSFYSLVVACDMPFLNVELLKYLVKESHDADVVIPESPEGPEPLHAVYSKNCISPIEKKLAEGDFRIVSFFDEVKVKHIGKDEVIKLDPHHLSFFNINTPEDLAYARKIYSDSSSCRGRKDMLGL